MVWLEKAFPCFSCSRPSIFKSCNPALVKMDRPLAKTNRLQPLLMKNGEEHKDCDRRQKELKNS